MVPPWVAQQAMALTAITQNHQADLNDGGSHGVWTISCSRTTWMAAWHDLQTFGHHRQASQSCMSTHAAQIQPVLCCCFDVTWV